MNCRIQICRIQFWVPHSPHCHQINFRVRYPHIEHDSRYGRQRNAIFDPPQTIRH